MTEKTLNLRGLKCPLPALRTRKALSQSQPGDVLLLQESPGEAFARYFTEAFRFNLLWTIIHGPHETGTTTVNVP